jgi:hypothetical protein
MNEESDQAWNIRRLIYRSKMGFLMNRSGYTIPLSLSIVDKIGCLVGNLTDIMTPCSSQRVDCTQDQQRQDHSRRRQKSCLCPWPPRLTSEREDEWGHRESQIFRFGLGLSTSYTSPTVWYRYLKIPCYKTSHWLPQLLTFLLTQFCVPGTGRPFIWIPSLSHKIHSPNYCAIPKIKTAYATFLP